MKMFWSTAYLLLALSPLLPIAGCTETVPNCPTITDKVQCESTPSCTWSATDSMCAAKP